MHIGIDFDNTIICYDGIFHQVAVDRGMIPAHISTSKNHVRDYLRQQGREDEWTELQGLVYGPHIKSAQPYPKVTAFIQQCQKLNIPVSIVSHKTRYPFIGEKHDLHTAARTWLQQFSIFDQNTEKPVQIYLEETKEEKINRIKTINCTHFIDDLPEILSDPKFSHDIIKILFDPDHHHSLETRFQRVESWKTLLSLLGAN